MGRNYSGGASSSSLGLSPDRGASPWSRSVVVVVIVIAVADIVELVVVVVVVAAMVPHIELGMPANRAGLRIVSM